MHWVAALTPKIEHDLSHSGQQGVESVESTYVSAVPGARERHLGRRDPNPNLPLDSQYVADRLWSDAGDRPIPDRSNWGTCFYSEMIDERGIRVLRNVYGPRGVAALCENYYRATPRPSHELHSDAVCMQHTEDAQHPAAIDAYAR